MQVVSLVMLSPVVAVIAVGSFDSVSDAVYKRYSEFVKASPCFQVTVTAFKDGFAGPKGLLTVERGRRVRLDAKWLSTDYSAVVGPTGLRELERTEKIYDEVSSVRNAGPFPSRLSSIPDLLVPNLLFTPDLANGAPKGGKVVEIPSGFQLSGTQQTEQGTLTYQLRFDRQGRLSTIDFQTNSIMGRSRSRWVLSDYKIVPPGNRFALEFPNGFSPYALATASDPVQVGEKIPLQGWVEAKSGRAVSLGKVLGGSPALLVLLGEGAPNDAARKSLRRLRSSIPIASLGGKPAVGASVEFMEFVDPKGDLVAGLRPLGTPMFYLIDKTGRVARTWFGFDGEKAAEWERDVLAATKKLIATPATSTAKP